MPTVLIKVTQPGAGPAELVPQGGSHSFKSQKSKVLWNKLFRAFQWSAYLRRAVLESQVTKKIEDAVAGLGNIDYMISIVSDGNSKTTINFILGTNSDRATNDVCNQSGSQKSKSFNFGLSGCFEW